MLRILVLAVALSIAGSVEAATYRLFFEVENGTYLDRVANTSSPYSISGHVDIDTTVTGSVDFGGQSRTMFGGATGGVPAPTGAMAFSLPLGSAPNLASSGSSTFFELHSFETFDPRSWTVEFGVKQTLRVLSETWDGSLRHFEDTILVVDEILPPRNGDGTSDFTVTEDEYVTYLRDLISRGAEVRFRRASNSYDQNDFLNGYFFRGSGRYTGLSEIDGIGGEVIAPVPVPAGLALLGSAFAMLGGLGVWRGRRLKAA